MSADTLYDSGRDGFLNKEIDWVVDTITAMLVDLADYGKTITGAADNGSGLIRITSATHGYTTGDVISIVGVVGTTEANDRWVITVIDADNYDLVGSTFTNTYTSGGNSVNVSVDNALDDIPAAARVASQNLANKSTAAGVADADDVTFSAVTGDECEALVLYLNTGVESTSILIALIVEASGLPITPAGADIKISWDNGDNKIFKL